MLTGISAAWKNNKQREKRVEDVTTKIEKIMKDK